MIGLGFLLFFVLWGIGCALVSWLLGKLFPSPWRPWVGLVLFVVLTPMLLIDEVIGKRQFERLCREQSVYIAPDARGRTVYLQDASFEPINCICLRGWIQKWQFVDATTKKIIVSYNGLHSDGGWFMRSISWGVPLLYDGNCYPANEPREEDFKAMGVNYIEPPDKRTSPNKGETR